AAGLLETALEGSQCRDDGEDARLRKRVGLGGQSETLLHSFWHGGRSMVERGSDRADRSRGVPARPLVVVERVLGCLTPALVPAEQRALRVAGEEPRTPERAIVCRGLEYRDCLARDSQELLRPNRGARRQLM